MKIFIRKKKNKSWDIEFDKIVRRKNCFEYCVAGLGKEKAEKNKLESNNTGLCGVVIE